MAVCRGGGYRLNGYGHFFISRSISVVVSNWEEKVCPHCNVKLEEKSVTYCEEDGSYEVLALCNECLRTWQWVVYAEGKSTDLEQYFFG